MLLVSVPSISLVKEPTILAAEVVGKSVCAIALSDGEGVTSA